MDDTSHVLSKYLPRSLHRRHRERGIRLDCSSFSSVQGRFPPFTCHRRQRCSTDSFPGTGLSLSPTRTLSLASLEDLPRDDWTQLEYRCCTKANQRILYKTRSRIRRNCWIINSCISTLFDLKSNRRLFFQIESTIRWKQAQRMVGKRRWAFHLESNGDSPRENWSRQSAMLGNFGRK